MSQYQNKYISITCALTVVVCLLDPLVQIVLGTQFPGYSQIYNTISSLGASNSPVGSLISAWWVVIGIVFCMFAYSFAQVYKEYGNTTRILAWLIAMYGLGEGMGSGLFRADYINDVITTSAIIHDTLGGIGDTAILLFPLLMLKLISKETQRGFYILSWLVFVFGIVFILLFLFRFTPYSFISQYKGLWQKITLINTYIYFIAVAYLVWKKQKSASSKKIGHNE